MYLKIGKNKINCIFVISECMCWISSDLKVSNDAGFFLKSSGAILFVWFTSGFYLKFNIVIDQNMCNAARLDFSMFL